MFKRKNNSQNSQETRVQTLNEKHGNSSVEAGAGQEYDELAGLSDRAVELSNARRVLRLASWSNVFYLVTCG